MFFFIWELVFVFNPGSADVMVGFFVALATPFSSLFTLR